MVTNEQQHGKKTQENRRSDYLRLYVFYPLAWIIVSVILFYLVKVN